MNVVIYVYNGMTMLDAIGPYEILRNVKETSICSYIFPLISLLIPFKSPDPDLTQFDFGLGFKRATVLYLNN